MEDQQWRCAIGKLNFTPAYRLAAMIRERQASVDHNAQSTSSGWKPRRLKRA